jgi:hypothetical protein
MLFTDAPAVGDAIINSANQMPFGGASSWMELFGVKAISQAITHNGRRGWVSAAQPSVVTCDDSGSGGCGSIFARAVRASVGVA